MKQLMLFRTKKFIHDLGYLFCWDLNVDAYPAVFAHYGCGIITTMRNGKMVLFIRQKWFAGIGYLYEFIRKIGKKVLQQKTTGQMLQSFVRMSNVPVLRNIGLKEFFSFFYFPDAQAGAVVDLLLTTPRKHQDAFDSRKIYETLNNAISEAGKSEISPKLREALTEMKAKYDTQFQSKPQKPKAALEEAAPATPAITPAMRR